MSEVPGRRAANRSTACQYTPCDPCTVVTDDSEASFYCRECNEFLCFKCSIRHSESKLSRNHNLFQGDDMPKRKLETGNINLCRVDGEIVRFYCPIHDEFYCVDCTTRDHATCKVCDIKTIANGFEKGEEYNTVKKELARLSGELETIRAHISDNRAVIRKSYDTMIADIQSFRSKINSQLDILETEITDKVEGLVSKEEENLVLQEANSDKIRGEIAAIRSALKDQEEFRQNELLVISTQNAKASIQRFHDGVDKMAKNTTKDFEYMFNRNADLDRALKYGFGKIGLALNNTELKTCVHEGEMSIKHQADEKDCWITGCVELDDDIVAVADQNNCCVKVVDMDTRSILSYVKLNDRPWDITRISWKRLAVSCDDKIVFLKVSWRPKLVKLDKENDITVHGDLAGLAYSDGKLVLSILDMVENAGPKIVILSLDGQKISQLSNTPTYNWLVSPFYLTATSPDHTIYASDYDGNRIRAIGEDGTVSRGYTDPNLAGPYGIAHDGNGGLYVVGSKSANIHYMSKSCEQIGVVLDEEDGIESPQAIAVCKNSGRLVLSHNQFAAASLKNLLSVYKISR